MDTVVLRQIKCGKSMIFRPHRLCVRSISVTDRLNCVRRRTAVQSHFGAPFAAKAQLLCGRLAEVDHKTALKGTTVIDPDPHFTPIAQMDDTHPSAQGQMRVRSGEPVAVESFTTGGSTPLPTLPTVPGGQTLLQQCKRRRSGCGILCIQRQGFGEGRAAAPQRQQPCTNSATLHAPFRRDRMSVVAALWFIV